MPTNQAKHLWHNLAELNQPESLLAITDVIHREKKALVDTFYSYMMSDTEAASYLSAAAVEKHLKPGLERWMDALLCKSSEEAMLVAIAMQKHVGEVHARAEIPVNLVARGMRLLKYEINMHLLATKLNRHDLVIAVLRVNQLVDIAFEIMSTAYINSQEQGIRTEEAFRAYSASGNIAMEREKQYGALLEWENQLFRAITNDTSLNNFRLLSIHLLDFGFAIKLPWYLVRSQNCLYSKIASAE